MSGRTSAEFPQNKVNHKDGIYGSLQYSVIFRIDLESTYANQPRILSLPNVPNRYCADASENLHKHQIDSDNSVYGAPFG